MSFSRNLKGLCVILGVLLGSSVATADDLDDLFDIEEHATWAKYMRANRYSCPGPLDTLSESRSVEIGGKRYIHRGYQLELAPSSADKDDLVRVGIVSSIKDVTKGTLRNLRASLEWFKKEEVEWLLVNGDLAKDEFDLEEIIDLLLETKLPVLVNLGNLDSKGSWARVYKGRYKDHPQLVNGVWIRQIIADDVEFWMVPGYYDRRFVHQESGCVYKKEDVDIFRRKVKASRKVPLVLVSHGPPKGKGRRALDLIHDKKHVGDPELNRLIRRMKIPFGIYGHILEAGGRGVKADMKTPVKPGKPSTSLHLNSGSVSADPWTLNNGRASYGMSVIMELKGGKASYRVKRFKHVFGD